MLFNVRAKAGLLQTRLYENLNALRHFQINTLLCEELTRLAGMIMEN